MEINDYGIKVGQGVTFHAGSDCYPAVVVGVTPKTFTFHQVEHGENRKVWPDQDFPIYLDRLESLSQDRLAKMTKEGWNCEGHSVSINGAHYYNDPSF